MALVGVLGTWQGEEKMLRVEDSEAEGVRDDLLPKPTVPSQTDGAQESGALCLRGHVMPSDWELPGAEQSPLPVETEG